MARSSATIKANIMAAIAADPVLGALLTSTSLTSIYGLLAYVIAACQNLLEQSWDIYLAQITNYANSSPAANYRWLAQQGFIYQYDASGSTATNALTILSDGSLGYATVNPLFNIVTRCAVITTGNNIVNIKTAQGVFGSETAITGTALTQLQSYFDAKGTAGIQYNVISLLADQIKFNGTIYYKAGFGGVIDTNVKATLSAYMQSIAIFSPTSNEPINYTGIVNVDDFINAIKSADGVADFYLSQLSANANGSGTTTIVYDLNASTNNRQYIMAAGYGVMDYAHSSFNYSS